VRPWADAQVALSTENKHHHDHDNREARVAASTFETTQQHF
jgi:hypothetical protein